MSAKQDVGAIVRALLEHRSRERRIPLNRRRVLLKKIKGADFRINRYDIEIDVAFATGSANPFVPIDRVLNEIAEFEQRNAEELARQLTEVKVNVLKWAGYIRRHLSTAEYVRFVETQLLTEEPRRLIAFRAGVALFDALTDDEINEQLDLETLALLAEGERFQDRGIYFHA